MTRQRFTMMACGAAVLTAVSGAPASAQIDRARFTPAPCVDAPRLLVITPGGATLKARQDAERQLRSRLTTVLTSKDACIIPKPESDAILKASGWEIDTPLSVVDAVSLAQTQLRADEILMTSVRESGGNFEYSGRLILVQDKNSQWLRDSVPPAPGDPSLSSAAQLFAKEYVKVRKQLPSEKLCYQQLREGKSAEAAASARLAIAAYPPAVISRMCLADALRGQKKPDESLAVVDEMLKRDPENVRALLLAMRGYFEKSDTNKFADVAGRIVSLDPTNPEVEDIIGVLAQWRRADIAMPMIEKVLKNDPENKTLLEIEFRLLYAAGNWKRAIAKGEALAPIDTGFVDTIFVQRMYSAYANDSNATKVLEWLTTGTKKFPTVLSLAFARAQQLKRMGQTQAAIDEYKRLLALQPKSPGTRLYIASYFDELGQSDSALAWVRTAVDNGDDKAQAGGVAQNIALRQFQAASQRNKDTAQKAAALEDFRRIIPLLAFADSLKASDHAKYYWGIAALTIGADAVQKMDAQNRLKPPVRPTCEQVNSARPWLDTAAEKIMQGGKADPANAGSLLQTQIPALTGYLDQIKAQLRGCT